MNKIIIKKANAALKKYERTAKRRTLTEKERIKYTLLKVRVGKATIQDSNWLILKQSQYGTLNLNEIDYLTR
tara:strand:+ start:705 stop:920 length:216 start_codon:yes stop_codon:yes gene_type:complete